MTYDRLDALLDRFSVTAQMFHSGALCGLHDFPAREGRGQLHLVRRGEVRVQHAGERRSQRITEPSLLFYPRPLAHRLRTDVDAGADMACADVLFRTGPNNPLAQALPAIVVMPLSRLDGTQDILELLFREAFGQACGRQVLVNRLFEVVLIQILRALLQQGDVPQGLLAGLAHPRLARSLVAIHTAPATEWTLEQLAEAAGMSRSAYAAAFRAVLATTPGDYLQSWRINLTQDLLRRGLPLKRIVDQVGYGSVAALSRAFKAACQLSPREWLARGE